MKRFGLALSDTEYQDFLRCFPDHGSRSTILRRCIRQLVKKVRESGRAWDREADEIVENLMSRQKPGLSVKEIEQELYEGRLAKGDRKRWEY